MACKTAIQALDHVRDLRPVDNDIIIIHVKEVVERRNIKDMGANCYKILILI